ncbi:MAG: DeoR family transcriptional regulator [Ruthenibacterium sp.]
MGKRELRMNRLVDIIHSCGYMPIRDIAQMLKVSEMTVRRDLAAIEKSGLIKNVNGVVVSGAGQQVNREYVFESETQVQNEAKALIGHFAAGLISPGDCFSTPAPQRNRLCGTFPPRWSLRLCAIPATF